MRAILLSAGLATRLEPLSRFLPKCLAPVNGRPLMEYWLRALDSAGVGPVLVNLHAGAETVLPFLEKPVSAGRVVTTRERTLLGTGGTVRENRSFADGGPLMLIHGDNLCGADLNAFRKAHENRPPGRLITMMTFRTPTPETCGIVRIDSEATVRAFHEKEPDPPGNLANGAVYILEPEVIDFLESIPSRVIDFSTRVIPRFLGKIHTFHNDVYHRDIGSMESLLAAQIEFSGTPEIPEKDDPWEKICRSLRPGLSDRIASALAAHLEAPVVEASNRLTQPSKPASGRIVLMVREPDADLERLLVRARQRLFPDAEIVLLFPTVPSGFSSRRIYETHGVRSLALCAGPP